MQQNQQATETSKEVLIDVKGLSKKYGAKTVLSDVNLRIVKGEIVGLIGPNGAGKSTLLKAIMGLIKYNGDLSIFGQDPYANRTALLENMSYVADVASLPGWMKVRDLLQFLEQTHPKFNTERAHYLLKDTPIEQAQKVATLSKGMKTRLHLVILLALETDLLVLDEPTLGLDVLVRRDFQDRLIEDYYNAQRSILVTTHQIDEIESILTRVLFIKEGRITLDIKKSELATRYIKLVTKRDVIFNEQSLKPLYQRSLPDGSELIFEGIEKAQLSDYGEVVTPSLEDLFVAINS